MIDKFGTCPNCKMDWNRGDIFQTLKSLSLFQYASDYEVTKVANQYGWTDFKPTNFSKTITHQIQGTAYLVCPAFACGHVFNPTTDEEFESLWALHQKLKEPISDMVVTMNPEGILETVPVIEEEESPFHEEPKVPMELSEDIAYQDIVNRIETIIITEKELSKELGIPVERLGQPQTTHYGKDSTGSFSRFSQILRQGKRKAD